MSERAGTAVRDLNQHAGSLASLEGLGRQLMRSEALASSWIAPVRRDAAVLPLIEALPSYPFITARIGIDLTQRSRPAVIDALDRLAQAGVLTRHRNQKKGDRWEAKQLFELLAEFEHAAGPGQASAAQRL